MIVIPSVGGVALLNLLTDAYTAWYHLYTNPLTPNAASVLTDFVEASFGGYAPLRSVGWTDALVVGDVPTAYADALVFACTVSGSPQSIYGYYVTQGKTGGLLWAQSRDAGPVVITNVGDSLDVLPTLSLQTFVPC